MTPDLSSPAGFLLGFLGLVGVIALVYALYSVVRTRRIRSSGTDQLIKVCDWAAPYGVEQANTRFGRCHWLLMRTIGEQR